MDSMIWILSRNCCYQVITGRDVPKPSRLGPSSLKIEGLEKHQPTNILVGGWPTPLKKYEFVSWDDYSQDMEKWKMDQTTNQYPTWIYHDVWYTLIYRYAQCIPFLWVNIPMSPGYQVAIPTQNQDPSFKSNFIRTQGAIQEVPEKTYLNNLNIKIYFPQKCGKNPQTFPKKHGLPLFTAKFKASNLPWKNWGPDPSPQWPENYRSSCQDISLRLEIDLKKQIKRKRGVCGYT